MRDKKNYEGLKEFCLQQGASLFGVADVSAIKDEFDLPAEQTKDLDRAISVGFRLSKKVLDGITDKPTKIYYHHYRQVNSFLDQLALKVVNFIQKVGFSALAIPASQIVDWERQTAHLSHKKIAQLAGLGWRGRNNLIVNPKFGAQFRLVTILTDAPLECDKPVKLDCGKCKACISVCPAGAIKEEKEDFDHIACYEKLREFQRQRYADQFICGICVKACKGKSSA